MEVLFATSNENKVKEANKIGAEYGIKFKQVNLVYEEVRAESVRKVAEEGAKYVFSQIKRPIIVEDSGLFIDALNGFPGPYSAFAYHKIGSEGILKLMAGEKNRGAKFISAIGYADKNGVKVFEGEVEGLIVDSLRGDKGFGYDPIFQPIGFETTFAQDVKVKNQISHRRKSTQALCQSLLQ